MTIVAERQHYAASCSLDEDRTRYCACGAEMDFEECYACEDGYTAYGELHDMDPLWYDVDDIEACGECDGKGGWWICSAIRRDVAV